MDVELGDIVVKAMEKDNQIHHLLLEMIIDLENRIEKLENAKS